MNVAIQSKSALFALEQLGRTGIVEVTTRKTLLAGVGLGPTKNLSTRIERACLLETVGELAKGECLQRALGPLAKVATAPVLRRGVRQYDPVEPPAERVGATIVKILHHIAQLSLRCQSLATSTPTTVAKSASSLFPPRTNRVGFFVISNPFLGRSLCPLLPVDALQMLADHFFCVETKEVHLAVRGIGCEELANTRVESSCARCRKNGVWTIFEVHPGRQDYVNLAKLEVNCHVASNHLRGKLWTHKRDGIHHLAAVVALVLLGRAV